MKYNSIEKKLFILIRQPVHIYALLFATTFFLLSSLGVWLQLNGLRTPEYDTFWFDNVFYNTLHGNGFFYISPNHYNINQTYPAFSHFHQHNQPILLLILPFYYFIPSVYTLLGLQSILIGAGAIPLYLIGKELLDEISAKIIAISYLLYPTIMWNTLCFHPITFAPFFIFLMIYAYMKENIRLFYLCLFLTLILKENVPLVLFPLGMYLLYDSYREKHFSQNIKYKYILPLLVVTPLYFILSFKVVIPYFTGGEYAFTTRYSQLGGSLPEILNNLIENPNVFINELISRKTMLYMLQLLLPVSFVPVLSITVFSIGIPMLMQNLLSNSFAQICFISQYHFELISVIFLSVIVSFVKIKQKGDKYYKKYRMIYFYLVLFWCVIFSFIRVLIFISPKPLY